MACIIRIRADQSTEDLTYARAEDEGAARAVADTNPVAELISGERTAERERTIVREILASCGAAIRVKPKQEARPLGNGQLDAESAKRRQRIRSGLTIRNCSRPSGSITS
jgi:hypothetical protein